MTQKEKAIELVDKMKLATDEFGYININKERHKQCALIAVKEILKAFYSLRFGNALDDELEYWEEVKQEIEIL